MNLVISRYDVYFGGTSAMIRAAQLFGVTEPHKVNGGPPAAGVERIAILPRPLLL